MGPLLGSIVLDGIWIKYLRKINSGMNGGKRRWSIIPGFD
jgi:hypothetical protein